MSCSWVWQRVFPLGHQGAWVWLTPALVIVLVSLGPEKLTHWARSSLLLRLGDQRVVGSL